MNAVACGWQRIRPDDHTDVMLRAADGSFRPLGMTGSRRRT
jgi:hypothetical protein